MSRPLAPPSSPTASAPPSRAVAALAVAICFGAIVFDGYDLIVYGSVVPAMLQYQEWALTPAQIGAIGSYGLFGMFLGAIASGWLTDRLGRRRLFIGSLAWFSTMTLLMAFAPTAESFGVLRFLAGLGFGGIPPTAIALVIELAPQARRNLFNAFMLCGFPVGGVLAAILAINLLEPLGFRALFAIGGLPLITLVPLALWKLPESPAFLRMRSQDQRSGNQPPQDLSPQHQTAAVTPVDRRSLLRGRLGIAMLLFTVTMFASLLLVYGLNTWLPQLMRQAGYDLGSALTFLLVLNVGAIVGGIWGSSLSDKLGGRWITTGLFVMATASLSAIAIPLPTWALYLLIFVAGAATTGTQIVVYGYVATYFRPEVRATALGISSGVGRLGGVAGPLIGGALVAAGLGLGWNVATFAAVAVVGAVAAASVPRARSAAHPTAKPAPTSTDSVA